MNDNEMEDMRFEIQTMDTTLREYSASIREWNKMFAKLVLWVSVPGPEFELADTFDEGMREAKRHVAEVLRSRFPEEEL